MHPGIFNGPKSTQVTSDASSVEWQFKNASRTLAGFTTALDLMRTLNWNGNWATTDDVSQERKDTSTE